MKQGTLRAGRRSLLISLAAACAVMAMLASAPAANADAIVSRGSPDGIRVIAEEQNSGTTNRYNLLLTGSSSLDGRWRVRTQIERTCLNDSFISSCNGLRGGPRGGNGGTTGEPCDAPADVRVTVTCPSTALGARVVLSKGSDKLTVHGDNGRPVAVTAGAGQDEILSSSEVPSGGSWNVTLGSGFDVYRGSQGRDTVFGNAGDDRITPAAGEDIVNAGDGDGDQVFESAGVKGDSLDGGAGSRDILSYRTRDTAISVVRGSSTGGGKAPGSSQPGGEDNISGFEKILGGAGNDFIAGFASEGNGGDDTLNGNDGGNRINGGPGADSMKGFGGDDTIQSRDGVRDTRIECGTGSGDFAEIDLEDPALGLRGSTDGCEGFDRRELKEERGTIIASRRPRLRGRRVRILLRCPRRGKGQHRRPRRRAGCSGRLRLKLAENGARRPRAKRYRIRRGKSRRVTVRLTRREARRVRRAGRLRAVVSSRERGRRGRLETVTKKIQVKRVR